MPTQHNISREEIGRGYSSRASKLEAEVHRLRRLSRLFVWSQLATFAAAIGCVAGYVSTGGAWWWALAAALIAAYLGLRRRDGINGEELSHDEALLKACRNELAYMAGDYSAFDNGNRFADPKHPYSTDMDVFGPLSLYNRINRTVTDGGAEYLARCLEGQGLERAKAAVDRRREAIERLATMETELLELIATSRHGRVATNEVIAAANAAAQLSLPQWAVGKAGAVVAGGAVAVGLVLIVLAAMSTVAASVPMVWCTLALGVTYAMATQPLRDIGKAMGRLQSHAKAYADIVRLIADSGMHTVEDPAFGQQQAEEWREANEALAQLKAILASLDRRGNVIALLLGDAILLSDIFRVRRFARWQRLHATRIEGWIEAVSVMDALVSMAMFRRNEPQAVAAEIADGPAVEFKAEGLCHPFLGQKAIGNDFSIAEGHFHIITGANMAGKSTFLRAVGVNYILAANGLPVFAKRLQTTLFSLFSSMRTSDDLGHGISYFNAELLRLKQLIEYVKAEGHTLLILDEILKGTNSLDKLNGSRMFLNAMTQLPVATLAATHDLELSRLADEKPATFHNHCFEIGLGDTITYTYKMTPGVARNQNATHLLGQILKDLKQDRQEMR